MIQAVIKYFLSLTIVTASFGLFTTEDLFFHLGCYTSMIFGFMLQLGRVRKKQELTKVLVGWQIIITGSVCWGAFLCQRTFWPSVEGFGLMAYLFGASFFAMIISDTAYKIADISFNEWFKTLARKYWLDGDKEETK